MLYNMDNTFAFQSFEFYFYKNAFIILMKKEGKQMLKNIQTKKELKETIDKLKDMIVTLEFDPKTKVTIIEIKGVWKDDQMIQTRLSDADKEWISDLMVRTVKPIIDRLEVIENCPTIKNELPKK